MTERPPAPAGLGDRGTRFWEQTMSRFGLTDTETEILHESCRTMDALDQLAEMVAEDGPKSFGAAGQTVVHPAITAAAGLRVTLHRLLASLGLPDQDGQVLGSVQKTRSRTAAAARWSGHISRRAN